MIHIVPHSDAKKQVDIVRVANVEGRKVSILGPSSIKWTNCPVKTEHGDKVGIENISVNDFKAKCSFVSTTKNHFNEETESLSLYLKQIERLDAPDSPPTKVVIFLPGTPGGDSATLENDLINFSKLFPDGDAHAYTTEYRGGGRSNRLGCILSQAETDGSPSGFKIDWEFEFEACIQEFKEEHNANDFSVDQIALDVLHLIRSIDNQIAAQNPINYYIYGYSFGGYLINRVMQYYASEDTSFSNEFTIRGIILDGPQSPGPDRFDYGTWDIPVEQVGENILEYCDKYEECSHKFLDKNFLPMKVYPRLQHVFTKLYNNTYERHDHEDRCYKNVMKYSLLKHPLMLKRLLGNMIGDCSLRSYVPAIIHRLDRCDEIFHKDVTTVMKVLTEYFEKLYGDPKRVPRKSTMLLSNIAYSELYSSNITVQHMREIVEKQYFAYGNFDEAFFRSQWPTVDPSNFVGKPVDLSKLDVNILVMVGDLDATTDQTKINSFFKALNTKGKKSLLQFDHTPHHVVRNSFMTESDTNSTCGMEVLEDFVKNPEENVNFGCKTLLVDPAFNGNKELNLQWWGVEDIWNGLYEVPGSAPYVSLWLLVGVESATLLASTLIILFCFYWAVYEKCQVRKWRKKAQSNDGYNTL